jgi:hypothetical protein
VEDTRGCPRQPQGRQGGGGAARGAIEDVGWACACYVYTLRPLEAAAAGGGSGDSLARTRPRTIGTTTRTTPDDDVYFAGISRYWLCRRLR